MRIVHKVGFRDHTNYLFLKSNALKLTALFKFKLAQLMYKAKTQELPANIQKLFTERDKGYNLRGNCIFNKGYVRTNLRSRCISFYGVTVWNGLEDKMKESRNIVLFK